MNELQRMTLHVTPELARKWLNESNKRNRNPSEGVVKAYASDMKNGLWKQTHQNVIAFYKDGNLADGQHRLMAIVMSGISITFDVVHGLDKDSVFGIDAHYMRNTDAQIRMAGGREWITTRHIAVYKAMSAFTSAHRKLSPQEVAIGIEKHKERIDFVCRNQTTVKGVTVAPILAGISCALGNVSTTRLMDFYDVLISGVMRTTDDMAAIRLRERAMIDARLFSSSFGGRKDLFLLTQAAVKHFCEGNQIKKLIKPSSFVYEIELS